MANQKKIKLQGFRFKPFSAKQLKLLNWWQEGSPVKDKFMIVADGSIRAGKEQPLDATLFTPDGMKKMGDIKVSDYVFDRRGQPTKVVGIFPQGVKDVYKVTFQDGSSTECGLEHLWTYKKDGQNITETLKDIKDGLGDSPPYYQSEQYRFPLNECVNFAEKEVSMNPYSLGLLLGDETLGESLKQLNLGYNIPDNYKFNSRDVRLNILAGILNISGNIYVKNNPFIYYYSYYTNLVDDVTFIARSLGMLVIKNTERSCVIKVTGSLYELLVNRHKNLLMLDNDENYRFITSIEYVGKKECQCIYVDNEEHLYLTDDFIVTHNTVAMILSFVLFVMKNFNQQNAAMCGKMVCHSNI